MSPTLRPGTTVIVNKAAYRRIFSVKRPEQGHIVALSTNGSTTVKRVLGAAEDPIRVDHGRLYVGGAEAILSPGLVEALSKLSAIPAGFVFVTGDNGRGSYDSRHYGLVPIDTIVGRVVGARSAR